MNTETPEKAKFKGLAKAAGQILATVQAYKIDTPEVYELAAGELKIIKAKAKELTDLRLEITRPMDESKRKTMELFAGPLDQLAQAERALKDGINRYLMEQRRITERREAEAREAAAAEQRRIDEAARKEAAKLEKKGKVEEAQAVLDTKPVAQVAAVAPAAPKVAGISQRDNWKYEIVDLATLVRAVAAGELPLSYVQANTVLIGQQARSLKAECNIPGVRVFNDPGISAGRV